MSKIMSKKEYEERFAEIRSAMDKIAVDAANNPKKYKKYLIEATIINQTRLFTRILYKGFIYNLVQPRRVGKHIGGYLGIFSEQYNVLEESKEEYLNNITSFPEGKDPYNYLNENPFKRKFVILKVKFKNRLNRKPTDYNIPGNYRDVEVLRKEVK